MSIVYEFAQALAEGRRGEAVSLLYIRAEEIGAKERGRAAEIVDKILARRGDPAKVQLILHALRYGHANDAAAYLGDILGRLRVEAREVLDQFLANHPDYKDLKAKLEAEAKASAHYQAEVALLAGLLEAAWASTEGRLRDAIEAALKLTRET